MTDVTIDRFRARYRIPVDADEERRRLDGMLDRAFESALETGLELAGVGDAELVCVRELHVPFQADLSRTEGALAGEWAEAFGRILRRALDEESESAVRYRSPSAALTDIVRSAARGDFGSAWAWASMGLWDTGDAPSDTQAARGVSDALAARPELAPPVLEAAADDVTASFLVENLDAGSWRAVAAAALSAAGLPPALAAGPEEEARPSSGTRAVRPASDRRRVSDTSRKDGGAESGAAGEDGADPEARPELRIPESVAASALIRHASRARVSSDVAPAVAALALLAGAPSRLHRSGDAGGLVRELGRRITAEDPGTGGRAPASAREEGARRSSNRSGSGASPGTDGIARAEATEISEPVEDDVTESSPHVPEATTDPRKRPTSGPGEVPTEHTSDDAEARAVEKERTEAGTLHGGLPFLLHLLDDTETRTVLLDEPGLEDRSLPWILHRLGVVLTSASDDDPAVLAFCGLGPEADPPSHDEAPPTSGEEKILDSWADRLRIDLKERLQAQDRSPATVTREVVRREATVVADPGWIEVRLSLRDVSPAIRKAGLDLDPDFLEWLGVVVRIAYV